MGRSFKNGVTVANLLFLKICSSGICSTLAVSTNLLAELSPWPVAL